MKKRPVMICWLIFLTSHSWCETSVENPFDNIPMCVTTNVELLPPTVPRDNDPDHSSIEDTLLRKMYMDTVYTPRILSEKAHEQQTAAAREAVRAKREAFLREARPEVERRRILANMKKALAQHPPDWNLYRVALWCAKKGMKGDDRLIPGLKAALKGERGEKISDDQGRAVDDTINYLGTHDTEAAADLLYHGVSREFWGDAPFRSRITGTSTLGSLSYVRTRCLFRLAELPVSVALPRLGKLREKYPEIRHYSAPVSEYVFEKGAGYLVAKAVYNLKKKAGMAAVHPRELLARP
jgi:hypothetical protein